MQRDQYDALYETSRYEDMIVMPRPSSAQARRELEEEEMRKKQKMMLGKVTHILMA
jgi:hypothetical protein